ncbi:MAG: hypothetical protein AAFW70_10770 [Cyanobacteria bacterium J06635_10]
MSLNLNKLAVASAIVVSTVGFFAESAEAQNGEAPIVEDLFAALEAQLEADVVLSNEAGQLQRNGDPLQAVLGIETDASFENAVRNVSFLTPNVGTFFTSEVGSIEPTLLNTPGDVDNFLTRLDLDEFGITRDDVFDNIQGGNEPIASYVLNLNNDLAPNDEAQLVLFFDEENATFPRPGGLQNLINSPAGVDSYDGEETVPAVLIRNFRNDLDDASDIVINNRVIDRFGVDIDTAPLSRPFSVTAIPESSTGNAVLIAGAFGGLLILKRNQRVKKSIGKIEN